jgi:hypothetical protein
MKFIYVLGIVLMVFGFVINFVPTLLYFATVYPDLKDSFLQRDAFLRYGFAGGPAIRVTTSNYSVILHVQNGSIILKVLNESCLGYDVSEHVMILREGNISEREVYLNNLETCENTPLYNSIYNYLILQPGQNTVNVSGKSFKLRRPASVYVNVGERNFLLYAIDYASYRNDSADSFLDLLYVELATGHKVLLDEYIIEDIENPIVQIAYQALLLDAEVGGIMKSGNTTIADASISVFLMDGNIKPSLDISKRFLLDFTYNFFPLNIALLLIGIILIIIARRRVVR